MTQWIISLSEPERWAFGITIVFFGGLITQWFSHCLAEKRDAKARKSAERKEYLARVVNFYPKFREAIAVDFIGQLRGHALVGALLGSVAGNANFEGIYIKHRKADDAFRGILKGDDLVALNRAGKLTTAATRTIRTFWCCMASRRMDQIG